MSSDERTSAADGIDTDLYSRQIYVMGLEAMRRMAQSNVLISGLSGLGVEVAKNVILAGVKSVTLHDDTPTALTDLASQFYLTQDDLGKPRAASCLSNLRELNQHVPVSLLEGALSASADSVGRFQVVVIVDPVHEEQLLEIGDYCHANGIRLIVAGTYGVAGFAFSDFGEEFTVFDPNGEEPRTGVIVNITQGAPGVVTVAESTPHGLADGDHVEVTGVEGMEDLNGQVYPIKVVDPNTFSICDTAGMAAYVRGGYFKEVKQPRAHKYLPLRAALDAPPCEMTNFIDMERPQKLHALLRALWGFRRAHGGAAPAPGNDAQAREVAEAARAFFSTATEADERLWFRLARVSSGQLNPLAAFFGGAVGQEVLKACTGKFTPLNQWLHLDFAEMLPREPLPAEELVPAGDRYDGQVAVLGRSFQEKLKASRFFLVGAGALGCEFLKNLAMMGMCTGDEGQVTVTDMDSIEKSNLNRQFLFRPWDVTKMKSDTAAAAARAMNPALRVRALQTKVAPDTESTFDDAFWTSLTGVITALDNVQARLYVDSRCVYFGKPLVDSGTLGTKAHSQPVVPGLTISYGSVTDAPEQSIPVCTLKTFPNQIEHTIQWARDLFEELYRNNPEEVNVYLTTPDYAAEINKQRNLKLQRAKTVATYLQKERPTSFEDCIRLARLRFEGSFANNIKQLLHKFPLDMMTGDPPKPFWSGTRKPPTPLVFSMDDATHMAFVVSAANLYATVYGIKGTTDESIFRATLPSVTVPEFNPDTSVKIATTDEEAKELAKEQAEVEGLDEECERVLASVPPAASLAGLRLQPEEFEKDDDTNFHMDFITACSNLRARNYRIPEADKLRTKQIAGRIIPAIATTTALATGAVMIEMIKALQSTSMGDEEAKGEDEAEGAEEAKSGDDGSRLPKSALSRFRSSNFNLAINAYSFFEPEPCELKTYKKKGEEVKFTLWDKIDLEGDMTLQELVDVFEEEYGYELCSLSTKGASAVMLYSSLLKPEVMEPRLELKLTELFEEVTGQKLEGSFLNLEVDVEPLDDDMDDMEEDLDEGVELPPVRVRVLS